MARRRILLIDGESPHRDALARALAVEGHEVQASGISEALGRLETFRPNALVGSEEGLRMVGGRPGLQTVPLIRPVNVEELRRVLRES
ncbi:MAG: hypothetical protein AMS21_04115 [Gemmatimonas sp. SG8_38_2]|nr:MAG: hypothetical protein AMS21_04115 [Gemmatimonas sp. SG8_38_2]